MCIRDSGNNGKSTYELWKETVGTGNINDPKNPGQKWPSDKVSEYDFFNYLAGKDGINGSNGLSAHELWKNDLAKRCEMCIRDRFIPIVRYLFIFDSILARKENLSYPVPVTIPA